MNWIFLILSIVPLHAAASIFGGDDRVDIAHTSDQMQELARSVPALIQKKRIIKSGDHFVLRGTPLTEFAICSDEAFSQESIIANCSGSLIAPNKVLTAAHCLNESTYQCSSYSVVFDYQRVGQQFKQEQIYHCKKILYYNFDKIAGADLAVIELERPVEGRSPVKINLDFAVKDEIFMIGYPMGIGQKLSESAQVLSIAPEIYSFHTNLDSFSVNSGSPIFNEASEQIGVLVRGTGSNFEQRPDESCQRWHQASSEKEFSAGNDLKLLPKSLLK